MILNSGSEANIRLKMVEYNRWIEKTPGFRPRERLLFQACDAINDGI